MKLYSIRNWNTIYENNRTRELKNMAWVPVPNSHDGDGYTELVSRKNGAALLGAWLVILQVASRCDPRGTLLRRGEKPHTADSLSRITRLPKEIIAEALIVCSTEPQWLDVVDFTTKPQEGAGIPQEGAVLTHPPDEEGNGKKGMEGNGNGALLPLVGLQDVFDGWNAAAQKSGLPQCLIISDKRRRQIQARLRDDFFVENWRSALVKISDSPFCKGTNDRGWKASFDWFITPDVVAKAMEGKYSGSGTVKKNSMSNVVHFRQDATFDARTPDEIAEQELLKK